MLPLPLLVPSRGYLSAVAHFPTDAACASEAFSGAGSWQLLPIRAGTHRTPLWQPSAPVFPAHFSRVVYYSSPGWKEVDRDSPAGTYFRICLSWGPQTKAAPGFRDPGRITSGELISNQREFQFQVARRRHNQDESLINTDATGWYGFLCSWAPGLWV